jgi:hypothetical protein
METQEYQSQNDSEYYYSAVEVETQKVPVVATLISLFNNTSRIAIRK